MSDKEETAHKDRSQVDHKRYSYACVRCLLLLCSVLHSTHNTPLNLGELINEKTA